MQSDLNKPVPHPVITYQALFNDVACAMIQHFGPPQELSGNCWWLLISIYFLCIIDFKILSACVQSLTREWVWLNLSSLKYSASSCDRFIRLLGASVIDGSSVIMEGVNQQDINMYPHLCKISMELIQSGILLGVNARVVGIINLTSTIRWWD